MASPAIVGTPAETAITTASLSHVVNLPAGAVGNVMLAIMDKGSSAAAVSALTGWVEILDENQANGLYIAARECDGTEGATTTFTLTGTATRGAWIVYEISGAADPNVTPPQIGTTGTGTSATPDPPASATPPSSKDYLFIAFAGMAGEEADDDTWGNTPPTNYTPSPPRQKACGTVGTNLGGLILSAERALTTGSAENPGTFGVDVSAAWRSQTITVHPPTPTATPVARISLASATVPDTRTAHSIKARVRKASGTGTVIFKAALYEGGTNRSGDIATSALTTSLADYTLAIPDASAANITDYSNLEIRFWAESSTGDAVNVEVARIILEIPETTAAGTTYPIGINAGLTLTPAVVWTFKRPISVTATVTPTMAVARNIKRTSSVTVTFTNSLSRKGYKAPSANLTFTNTLVRKIGLNMVLGTTLTPTLTLGKLKLLALTGNLTMTPVLGRVKTAPRAVTASLVLAAALQRKIGLNQNVTVTISPALQRKISKTVPLTVTLAAAMTFGKLFQRSLSGNVTLSPLMLLPATRYKLMAANLSLGAALGRNVKLTNNVTVVFTPTVSRLMKFTKPVTLTLTPAMTQGKLFQRPLSAGVTLTAVLARVKQAPRAFPATVTFTMNMGRKIGRVIGLPVILSPVIARQQQLKRNLSVTLTNTLGFTFAPPGGVIQRSLSATVTFTAALTKLPVIQRALSASLTLSTALNRVFTARRAFSATASLTAALSRKISKSQNATVTLTPTLVKSKTWVRALSAALNLNPAAQRRVGRALSVQLQMNPVLKRQAKFNLLVNMLIASEAHSRMFQRITSNAILQPELVKVQGAQGKLLAVQMNFIVSLENRRFVTVLFAVPLYIGLTLQYRLYHFTKGILTGVGSGVARLVGASGKTTSVDSEIETPTLTSSMETTTLDTDNPTKPTITKAR